MPNTKKLKSISKEFFEQSVLSKYSYNFSWMSRPIIQYPQDIMAIQEIVWSVKPDLIIETGIAHGGSLVYSASMLALIDYCEAKKNGNAAETIIREDIMALLGENLEQARARLNIRPIAHYNKVHEIMQDNGMDPYAVVSAA